MSIFIWIALILLSITAFNLACSRNDKYVNCEGMVWNTLYHITYMGPESLKDSILPVLNKVGSSLSVFDKNSLVTKLNESDSVIADNNLVKVYDASCRIHDLSSGRFDPTLSPLIDAWGFGMGHTPNVDTLAVDSIKEFIGITKTRREKNIIYKNDPRIRFNFSAIAKGYGCDAIGEMFIRNGVTNFMIEIGGELSLRGKSPSGNDWNIAVDAPLEGKNPGEESAIVISLTDVGIATSGNYRNFRNDNGRKTAHTISPETGRPFLNDILSATVVASTCMEADGFATACMASSPEDAKILLESPGIEGLLIFADSVWMTNGFRNYVK